MNKIVTTVSIFLAATLANAQDAPLRFKSTEVVPGIYMLEGDGGFAGGNIGLLVGDERIVLVDDGLEPLAPVLIDAATKVAGRPIDFVINTHVHGDHVGGNAALAAEGATIVAHDNIRSRLIADAEFGPEALPVMTFSDAITFHVNDHEAFVFHIEAAHTDGDAVIHYRNVNVIQTGDIMFNHLFPFIDLDNGGTVDGYIAGQQRILAMADDETIIIPGHGPLATKAELERDLDVLIDCKARVKALVDQGKSESEVHAANPLAVYHEGWNWGFITTERMTNTLYRDLTASSRNSH
jgi:glyoxylase-like metal-dependent hydrolase (beta-lactamase superfamily II)